MISFRNAPVSALIYEFLYDAYTMIELDRSFLSWAADEEKAPLGLFDHRFTSKWEWSADILVQVGAIIPFEPPHVVALKENAPDPRHVQTPFHTPVMTLEECESTDFSAFETFDNYCYAMFTFDQHVDVDHRIRFTSPRFLDAVAARDDIFDIGPSSQVNYNRDRFNEKVMTRWEELQVREFKAVLQS